MQETIWMSFVTGDVDPGSGVMRGLKHALVCGIGSLCQNILVKDKVLGY